jgi:hypothetical protein
LEIYVVSKEYAPLPKKLKTKLCHFTQMQRHLGYSIFMGKDVEK